MDFEFPISRGVTSASSANIFNLGKAGNTIRITIFGAEYPAMEKIWHGAAVPHK